MLQLCSFYGAKAVYQREDIDRKEPHESCTNVGFMEHAVVSLSVRTGTVEFRETSGSQLAGLLTTSAALCRRKSRPDSDRARHAGAIGNFLRREGTGHRDADATKGPVQTSELGP
jgi:hypothetical protein